MAGLLLVGLGHDPVHWSAAGLVMMLFVPVVNGGLLGTGPGSGMALMFVLSGLAGLAISLAAYGLRIVRDVEDLLPDHQPAAMAASLQSRRAVGA